MFYSMRLFVLVICLFACARTMGQATGSFHVNGNANTFYPVSFLDAAWSMNIPSEMILGRSSTHQDASWHGSVIASFSFHVTSGGNGSQFINVTQAHNSGSTGIPLIAGWQDVTADNASQRIVVWLRGNTTYQYRANVYIDPVVYDGIQNALPFVAGSFSLNTKASVDPHINQNGLYSQYTAFYTGPGLNYLGGNLGIGTISLNGHRLAVEGSIGARKIKVDQATWADYVFAAGYKLRSIPEVEAFIKTHQHLPDIPSGNEVQEDGLDVGEMDKMLLQKVEELTLYLIDQHKKIESLTLKLNEQAAVVDSLNAAMRCIKK
ncbi:hypothetical protein MKQ68_10425 [Chitinophaga horti]|uniref:Peptidase S74 domain-containing protein n=1 Tax=Chitinophaga horti TaxID=2920382 RepID=A0ABY6J7P7_9BACT|nr:hypothetical protein [Chitinophaga horti]UYQ95515.1 hypothetical protein MKQ68_10425 [Chitinophaga horti]